MCSSDLNLADKQIALAGGGTLNFTILTSGLVSVFYDFCENLSPELFYSEEEAKRIIFG